MSNLSQPATITEAHVRDIVLRDGSTLALRPGRGERRRRALRFFDELSPQSRYQRFLGFPGRLRSRAASARGGRT